MEKESKKSKATGIREWVQFALLLFASAWAIWTFVFKEVMAPRSAPINITMNLDLKEVGARPQETAEEQESLSAVEMKISAKNPSSRTIYLLRSAWVATGYKIASSNGDDEDSFVKDTNDVINLSDGVYEAGRDFALGSFNTVAVGRLFLDSVLKPGESVSRTLIVYVPREKYDMLEVQVLMPTVAVEGAVDLDWTLNKDGILEPTVYRLGAPGRRVPMEPDQDGGFSDDALELQMATSMAQLSLWH